MEYNYVKRVEQKFPCGCHVDEMIDGSYGISYCPNHKAAPAMYEALKDCVTSMTTAKHYETAEHLDGAIAVAKEALSQAEDK